MNLNYKETIRYLGYGKQEPDAAIRALIEDCWLELDASLSPKCTWDVYRLQHKEENRLCFAGMEVTSKSLNKNLAGCGFILLFAATLGPRVDLLIGKYTRLQMSRAVVLQAAAAAAIEDYCNGINTKLKSVMAEKGLYLRPRFSPGYGDFDLAHQRQLITVLDTPKKIGLTLTDSLIMAPAKSVTAVIGLSEYDTRCHLSGCEACGKTDCEFRRFS